MEIFWGIALISAIILIAAAAIWIRRKIRRISKAASAVIKNRQDLMTRQPKSVTGMTSVYLPQIERDFPGFNYPVFRQRAENTLREIFRSLDSGKLQGMEDVSEELREQVRLRIEDNRASGRSEHYRDIVLHQTEISRYEKREGRCIITLQTAVGYRYYALEGGQVTDGSREYDTQTKYNVELHYLQDVSKLAGSSATAIGVTCPNCGAPVTAMGVKTCEYCGTGIIPIEDRVWKINRYEEAC